MVVAFLVWVEAKKKRRRPGWPAALVESGYLLRRNLKTRKRRVEFFGCQLRAMKRLRLVGRSLVEKPAFDTLLRQAKRSMWAGRRWVLYLASAVEAANGASTKAATRRWTMRLQIMAVVSWFWLIGAPKGFWGSRARRLVIVGYRGGARQCNFSVRAATAARRDRAPSSGKGR